MNEYRRAMDCVPLPEGLEGRLAAAVLAAERLPETKVIRPMSFARKVLLAAALALALTASVGAAVLVDWDAIFTDRFGQTPEEVPGVEALFQRVDAESVCGDVTLRVSEVLGDNKSIYTILEYRLPEGTDLERVRQAWEGEHPEYQVRLPKVNYYATGDVTWEDYAAEMGRWWPDIDWTPQKESDPEGARKTHTYTSLPSPLKEHRFIADSSARMESLDFDAETGTMRFLLFYQPDGTAVDLTAQPLTLWVSPPSITIQGETTALADHPALVTFRPTQTARAKTGTLEGEDFRLTVTVSPLSVKVDYYGTEYDGMGHLAAVTLVMEDGAERPLGTLIQGYSGGSSASVVGGVEKYSMEYSSVFREILDIRAVTAIRFDGREFTLTEIE